MIEPRYSTLQSLFADRVFRIPAYQRFYSWHSKQREDLFSDITKLAKSGTDQHHFMATVVCHKTSEVKPIGASQYRLYDVVDGQQRLTTLILILKCIELQLPSDSEDRRELAKILVKRDGQLILLQTNNANEHLFNKYIRDGKLAVKGEIQTQSDRNLVRAMEECRVFVDTWDQKGGMVGLMQLLLHRLGFVVYDTEDSRIIYTLLKFLTAGVSLSTGLIRLRAS